MTEVLRLIGLSQDGSLLTLTMVGIGVWVIMSIKQLRTDQTRTNTALADLKDDHRRLETAFGKMARGIADLRADIAFLRGRAEQGG